MRTDRQIGKPNRPPNAWSVVSFIFAPSSMIHEQEREERDFVLLFFVFYFLVSKAVKFGFYVKNRPCRQTLF